jgi:hypothetical protein
MESAFEKDKKDENADELLYKCVDTFLSDSQSEPYGGVRKDPDKETSLDYDQPFPLSPTACLPIHIHHAYTYVLVVKFPHYMEYCSWRIPSLLFLSIGN